MNLVFVGHRCCDHSPSSGYDQVCSLFPEAGWLSGPKLTAGQLSWIREPANPDDGSPPVFHVFYGDCSGSALPAILRERFPQATIVSTIHQPVSRLKQDPAGWASLSTVDGIITVSRIQARQLADLGERAPIRVVPHGVWTQVFRPVKGLARATRDRVLIVGNSLRDWDTTARIVEALATIGVRSMVLGSAAPSRLSVRNPLVEITPWVPEADLAAWYDQAAALILSVVDATASNALLEAMAAGCPVICPRFPSLVDEYLGDDTDAYEPSRYEEAIARVLAYIENPQRRAARSATLMKRAVLFDWARLRPLLSAAYRGIIDYTGTLDKALP